MTAQMDTRRIAWQAEDRYARQAAAGWSQRTLADARVLVVGAGAIGNEVVKGLALVGVGQVVVVDMDVVAPSNLTRSVLFRASDVGRPKAEVVCERASELNPDGRVRAVVGDIEWTLSDADFAAADVVVGCLDNAYARSVLNRRTRLVERPWFDGAISVDGVQVSAFLHPGPCWECSIGARTLEQLRARFSCTGFRREPSDAAVPTTAVTASVSGALLLARIVDHLHGDAVRFGTRESLAIRSSHWTTSEIGRRSDCPHHEDGVVRTRRSTRLTADATWAEVIEDLGLSPSAVLHLPYALATALTCSVCGRARTHLGPLARIALAQGICGSCGGVEVPTLQRDIQATDPAGVVPLTTLGRRSGDRLLVESGTEHITVETSGGSVWPRRKEGR